MLNCESRMRKSLCVGVLIWGGVSHAAFAQFEREMPQYSATTDGVVSEAEMQNQLVVPMVWPVDSGSLLLDHAGFSEEEISATWYVSWDATNLFISAVVKDDTPVFRLSSQGTGNVAYNAQDVMQPVFNPFNNPDHLFTDGIPDDEDPGDSLAAIYDIILDTSDEFGPDIYRHGPKLDSDEWESITVAGSLNEDESGYTVETAIPWAVAMDDAQPDYVPSVGDVHGLSFIVLGFSHDAAPGEAATLFTDFGDGLNTIGDPTTWNSVKLIGPNALPGDFNADGQFDAEDLDALSAAVRDQNPGIEFDLNGDGAVTNDDRQFWIQDVKGTWVGDSNLDGEFNSSDFVVVFTAGKFELQEDAGWAEGDWNGNQRFDSSDFVAAFTDGGFELGPRASVASVPEPTMATLVLTSCWLVIAWQRRDLRTM